MEKRWFLNPVDIISGLPQSEKDFFFEQSIKKTFKKGKVIFSPGDEGNMIYYVLKGRVKIYDISLGGKEVIYWFCGQKEFFGLAEICGGEQRTVFAEAVEDTETLTIDKNSFEKLISRNPSLSFALMRILGKRIRLAHDTIKDIIICDVPSRLARLIIKLSEICGEKTENGILISKKFTHQEMADMIGATRTTVTEVMNDFKRKGLLIYESGRITVVDSNRLLSVIDTV
ncbi:MAG: Crp/Fnr family transcriptional regulator [Thermodesulfovibrionales bacterium]|nr:Crp/Fnr family transcriptional regulator [Thermodesulfovibrionales bacterium]